MCDSEADEQGRPATTHEKPDTDSQNTVAFTSTHQWTGPLPSPSALRQYENVCSGSAERILRFMEREQEHRHDMDRTTLGFHTSFLPRGQWLAASLGVLTLTAAVFFGSIGQTTAACTALGVGLGSAVLDFLGQRQDDGTSEE